jgi:hypothetical protein
MIDILPTGTRPSVEAQLRYRRGAAVLGGLGLAAVSALAAGLTLLRGPSPAMLAWIALAGVVAAILYQPRYGIYLIVGLALLADRSLAPWYPFVKNFSSYESLLFVHDNLIISPLELCIALTAASWLGRMVLLRQRLAVHLGPLFWPALVFLGFVTFGLSYGLVRGGNVNIGLWEARPIYYVPAMLLLVSNLITTRAHVSALLWVITAALVGKCLFALRVVAVDLQFSIGGVDRIAEHAMSIHFNSFFVLTIAAVIFGAHPSRRLTLPLLLPLFALTYLANNRRASFIAMGVALVMIGIVLYQERRRLFWKIAPPVALAGLIYLAVFWDSYGALGLPANAVRSVLGQADERDASSNLYRMRENLNIMFTIQGAPLTGVGFGNKFLIVASMADISSYVWWEYITHNSILWIWMKAGVGGFLAMMFLIGTSLILGGQVIRRMPNGELRAAAVTAVLYLLMHYIYAYVDMSWDAVSLTYVGAMMGLINVLALIAARPLPSPSYRWPWQATPPPAKLLPFDQTRI